MNSLWAYRLGGGFVLALYLVMAIGSALIIYPWEFAYWQGKYPILAEQSYRDDSAFSIGTAILLGSMGFLGLILMYVTKGTKYGFKWQ